MARGNQRDKAREATQKKLAAQALVGPVLQKSKNTKTGSEMQRDKESVAAMMREKQKAADERKAAEAAKKK